MNYLLVSIDNSQLRGADPYKKEELEAQITLVQIVMNILTFGLLVMFAGVILKKAFVALRNFPYRKCFRYLSTTTPGGALAAVKSPKVAIAKLKKHLNDEMGARVGGANSKNKKKDAADSGVEMTVLSVSSLSAENGSFGFKTADPMRAALKIKEAAASDTKMPSANSATPPTTQTPALPYALPLPTGLMNEF